VAIGASLLSKSAKSLKLLQNLLPEHILDCDSVCYDFMRCAIEKQLRISLLSGKVLHQETLKNCADFEFFFRYKHESLHGYDIVFL